MTTNICTYTPTQGTFKGQKCLLPVDQYGEHEGPHIYDPDKVPKAAAGTPVEGSAFTEEEIANAISEEEIRKRSEKLDEAQTVWENARHRATPMILCPECNGNGSVVGGSLGDHCSTCNGQRTIVDDSAEVIFDMPDFAALRSGLTRYGDALAFRRHGLPPGLPAKRVDEFKKKMELPPASEVPTLDQIAELLAKGRAKHKELAAGAGPAAPQLPPAGRKPSRTGFETEGGMEDTASDAEIDAIEAEIANEP